MIFEAALLDAKDDANAFIAIQKRLNDQSIAKHAINIRLSNRLWLNIPMELLNMPKLAKVNER